MPNEQLILVGFLLVFAGMLTIFVGSFLGTEKADIKTGVGGFVGPIPFGFANDPRMLKIVMVLSLGLFAAFVIMKLLK